MAETRVELDTGFESGPKGLHKVSRIALETKTGGLADDSGILKRKVLEPDEFPRVSLDIICPEDPEFADIDVAKGYPHEGKVARNRQGHERKKDMFKDDLSKTA